MRVGAEGGWTGGTGHRSPVDSIQKELAMRSFDTYAIVSMNKLNKQSSCR